MGDWDSSCTSGDDLAQAIAQYADALAAIADYTVQPPIERLLDLLMARDRVQEVLTTTTAPAKPTLVKLIHLDSQLKELTKVICRGDLLAQCCHSIKPPESAWWWYLNSDADASTTQPRWMRFNWMWNLGTVVCLVFSTAFISQTAKAFSTKGFDFLGTLSTVGQGAGLAVVAGGALTDRGKRTVETVLSSLGIPESLYAKVTFGIAASLLTVSYGIHTNLPLISNWYYRQGQRYVTNNEWSQAQDSYIRAQNFDPDDQQSLLSLGELYENMGNFERAIAEYEKGVLSGQPEFLNALGRARLMWALEKKGWGGPIDNQEISQVVSLLLRSARHPSSQQNPRLLADVYTNLGIAAWAVVDFEAPLSENANRALDEAFINFRNAMQQEVILRPTAHDEQWRQSRGQCYLQLARLVNYHLNVRYDDAFYGRKFVYYGVDPRRPKEDEFNCVDMERGNHPGATPDVQLMTVVKNSTPIAAALQSINSGFLQPQLTNAKVLNTLQQRLFNRIQQNWQPLPLEQPLLVRVLVNAEAEVVQYYVYDADARSLALATPLYALWETHLRTKIEESLADFKVVFSTNGLITVTPWYGSYKVDTTPIANTTLRGALQLPTVESEAAIDAAEIAVLQELLWLQIWNAPIDLPEEAYAIFDSALTYRVSVNADGTIASYQPVDQHSAQNVENTFLLGVPIADASTQPQVDFRVEFKAGDVFRVTRWDAAPNRDAPLQ